MSLRRTVRFAIASRCGLERAYALEPAAVVGQRMETRRAGYRACGGVRSGTAGYLRPKSAGFSPQDSVSHLSTGFG